MQTLRIKHLEKLVALPVKAVLRHQLSQAVNYTSKKCIMKLHRSHAQLQQQLLPAAFQTYFPRQIAIGICDGGSSIPKL